MTFQSSSQFVTTSTIIRAAWVILLASLTGSEDVVVGVNLSGRNSPVPGIEKITGPTLTTVPVRVQIQGAMHTAKFLEGIQRQTAGMMPFEHTGLQNIRKISQSAEAACSFQILLVIYPATDINSQMLYSKDFMLPADLDVKKEDVFYTYPLTVSISICKDSLHVDAHFDSNLVDITKVRRWLKQFETIAQQLCSNDLPKTLNDLRLITEQDLEQIWAWNGMVPETVHDCMIQDLVSIQTRQRPDAPAIQAWDGAMTYLEFHDVSEQVAKHLRRHGIGPGSLVPVLFEKSKWASVAIMGIIKSGGAFITVDTTQPESRLRDIVQQCHTELIVCAAAMMDLARRLTPEIISVDDNLLEHLDRESHHGDDQDVTFDTSERNAASILYVMFTSGSTGTPKGAIITHQNFCSMIMHQADKFGFGQTTRLFDFASYSFDMGIEGLLVTLAKGGCICIPSEEDRMNFMERAIVRMKVNTLCLTPSVAKLIQPSAVPMVKSLTFGGERIDPSELDRWGPEVRVSNIYGPTECTVHALANLAITRSSNAACLGYGVGSVPWIVDSNNHERLVPIGTAGELVLEGPLVGLGYLNDTQKTAVSFISGSKWLADGARNRRGRNARLYKTGDIVSYNSNGSINFIGRKDNQVKLHGQRIEPGEIEHHAKQLLPQGGDIIVDVCYLNEKQYLTGFISPKANCAESGNQDEMSSASRFNILVSILRDGLTAVLPEYMIPAVYIPVEKIPLTTSGKVDRRRLKEIAMSSPPNQIFDPSGLQNSSKHDPTTTVERKLQKLWSQVLGAEAQSIGTEDSFFKRGGDSISAMQLARVAQAEGLALTVAEIFQNPRLMSMAQKCSKAIPSSQHNVPPFSIIESEQVKSMCDDAAKQCNVEVISIMDLYPCSPLQEGLMALTAKSDAAYVSRNVSEISSNTDLVRFTKAWDRVVSSNAILRTRIVNTSRGAMQVVISEQIEWKASSSLGDYLEQDSRTPMTAGYPLARWGLVNSLAEHGPRYFVWTIHHAIYDGWTLPLIKKQLQQAYDDDNQRKLVPDDVSMKHTPFNTFIKYLSQQSSKEGEAYWQTQLAGGRCTSIFPNLPVKNYQPQPRATVDQKLSVFPGSGIHVTLSSAIRATLAIIMSVLTGNPDVTFGATLTGRNAQVSGIESIVGPTITTVPIRIKVEKTEKIHQLLSRVQQQAVHMMPFEHFGIQNICRISGADSEIPCQFQSLLMVQPKSSDCGPETVLIDDSASDDNLADFHSYALMFIFSQLQDEVRLQASFDEAVIEIGQVKYFLAQIDHVLQQLFSAKSQDQTVQDIVCITPLELQTVWQWNANNLPPVNECVPEVFARIVQEHPDSVAISSWDGDLTYQELDERSDTLAQMLVENFEVAPGMIVPLYFEKSKLMPISMLAVSKAGAAFVANDPAQPEARFRSMNKGTGSKLALCSSVTAPLASKLVENAINVDELQHACTGKHDKRIPRAQDPSATMYIVFTSGSTGIPKGVTITHTNLASAVSRQAPMLGFNNRSRVLDFSSYSFDACIFNFFYTVLSGGCLCIPSETDRKEDIPGLINSTDASLVQLTPSIARLLDPERVPKLETLILAGEQLTQSDIESWKKLRLVNAYGPAECTTMCAASINPKSAGSIGRGVGSNLWITDVDDSNRLAPIGAIGEILIEGPIVGSGYINDDEKTAATVARNPPWLLAGTPEHPGHQGSLYRTGDLARYNPDGSLIFHGRRDNQVKLNGQRVELGEIEYHLRNVLPDTVKVIAEVITPQIGGPTLVAFIGAADRPDISIYVQTMVAGIEAKLNEVLPRHMIPAGYIPVVSVPMTVSGKTDRRKLKEMALSLPRERMVYSTAVELQEPQRALTEKESTLRILWSNVLLLSPRLISWNDRFFQIGGDSIAAMKLVGEARDYGLLLTTGDIFRSPQLSDLAALIKPIDDDSDQSADEAFDLLDIVDVERFIRETVHPKLSISNPIIADIVPTSPYQADSMRNLFQPKSLDYAFLDLGPEIVIDRLSKACNDLVQAFESLRTIFIDHGESFLQVILREALIQIELHNTEMDIDSWSTKYFEEDLAKYADLSKNNGIGELFTKFILVRGVRTRQRLIMRLSHAQYDGFSVPHIFAGLRSAYHGQSIAPNPPYSRFIRHSIRSKQASLEYWRNLLKGSTLTPELRYEPGDGVRVLRDRVIPNGNTTNSFRPSILLGVAWAAIMAELTGLDDIVIGNVVTGRTTNLPDVDKILGPCMNTIPIRLRFSRGWTFVEEYRSMAQQLLDSARFEALDWFEMAKECTDWPSKTRFGTAVHYQNLEWQPQVNLDDWTTQVKWHNAIYEPPWTGIFASPESVSDLRVILFASPKTMNDKSADMLLEKLNNVVQGFISNLVTSFSVTGV